MSPSSANWLVLLGGILMLIPALLQTGLVRAGIFIGALGIALGAAVRLAGGSLPTYWLVYLAAVIVVVGIVRQRRTMRPHLPNGT